MISVTTTSAIDGYRVTATKGIAQGATFEDMLRHAETLGANAILNANYDDALGGEALFHGIAVVVEPTERATSRSTKETNVYENRKDPILSPTANCPHGEN